MNPVVYANRKDSDRIVVCKYNWKKDGGCYPNSIVYFVRRNDGLPFRPAGLGRPACNAFPHPLAAPRTQARQGPIKPKIGSNVL